MASRCVWCNKVGKASYGSLCSKRCLDRHLEHYSMLGSAMGVIPTALITGGREYTPTTADKFWLRERLVHYNVVRVMHGGARGVDRWAGAVAHRMGYDVEVMPVLDADWESRGRVAGHERNLDMLNALGVNLSVLLVFHGGGGTENMVVQTIQECDGADNVIIDSRDLGILWPPRALAAELVTLDPMGPSPDGEGAVDPATTVDITWQVTATTFCAGFTTRDGLVLEKAPILTRVGMGGTLDEVLETARVRGYKVDRI